MHLNPEQGASLSIGQDIQPSTAIYGNAWTICSPVARCAAPGRIESGLGMRQSA